MNRLIKRYILKAQRDKDNDEVNEGEFSRSSGYSAFSCLDHVNTKTPHLMLFPLLSHRRTERDQAGHLQSALRAAGEGEPGHGDTGKAHQATGRSDEHSPERRAEELAGCTFLTNVDIRDVLTGLASLSESFRGALS